MSWIKVEDELPPYDLYVDVYGTPIQRQPQMGGNPPIVTTARRQYLRKTSIWKERERYQCPKEFSMMKETTHWQLRPEPPKENQ